MKSYFHLDSFSPQAREMRAHFDARFSDPRAASKVAGRLVWDYWNVPGQYRLLRTPAYHFFPKKLYEAFHRGLVQWGRENLGCHDISPPWMSCYVDGCRQELHADLPHGPWAFVFSLTNWGTRRFDGGETLILKDAVLDYWNERGNHSGKGVEHDELFTRVPARFNRLVVFDPRIPHGVSPIEGAVHNVTEGRLVIHGWFVQPRPFISGPLSARALQGAIEGLTETLSRELAGVAVRGVLSVRFSVMSDGYTRNLKILTNSLQPRSVASSRITGLVRNYLENRSFGRSRGVSKVTLPLNFGP